MEIKKKKFGQAKKEVSKNALYADVCISTSAAPTYFPPYYFETKDQKGNVRTFDLVDGGVTANNPVSQFCFVFNFFVLFPNKIPIFVPFYCL